MLQRCAKVLGSLAVGLLLTAAGAMAAHNDIAIVISANGTITQELSDDPGPGTAASKSSFASLMADSVLQTMGQS